MDTTSMMRGPNRSRLRPTTIITAEANSEPNRYRVEIVVEDRPMSSMNES